MPRSLPHTEETKEKLRRASTGRKQSAETLEKMRLSHLGKRHSLKTLEKMRVVKLGNQNAFGHRFSMTKETREKLSLLASTSEGRKKHQLAGMKSYRTCPRISRPHKRAIEKMEELNLRFEVEYPLDPYTIDIYLVDAKIAIEIDSVYWHNKNRDRVRDRYLLLYYGVSTIRIDESEVEFLDEKVSRYLSLTK